MKRLFGLVLLALAFPAAAHAGGWATAGLSSLPPADLRPGQPWTVDITILQHGRTPLEGVQPAVVVKAPGAAERRFPGRPTGTPGVYRATVVFDRAGRYAISVDDGFTNAMPHDFPAADVRGAAAVAPAPPPPEDGFPWKLYAGALAVLAAAGALTAAAAARARRGATWSASPR